MHVTDCDAAYEDLYPLTTGPEPKGDGRTFSWRGVRRMSGTLTARLSGTVTALATAVVMVAVTGSTPAQAVSIGDFTGYVGYVKQAYDAYQKFFGGALTLDQATTQIENAITVAKTEILDEIDAVQAADVQACARSAVIEVADIRVLSPDNAQAFAAATTSCVTLAQADVNAFSDPHAVDSVGFALNTVGPIALFARTYAGESTVLLKSTLASAEQSTITRLTPHCFGTPLWGDTEPGATSVEVQLQCTAFNGTSGFDSVFIKLKRGQPLPRLNYSYAIEQAMTATSYPVAEAALPLLAG